MEGGRLFVRTSFQQLFSVPVDVASVHPTVVLKWTLYPDGFVRPAVRFDRLHIITPMERALETYHESMENCAILG